VSELHKPLADGYIRLLELNFEHEHDIVGRLDTGTLTAAPAYCALSYVCGNEPYEHEVAINNVLFKVKPNLHAALRRLQSFFRSAGIFRVVIWIDAICIDQINAEEKAKQIQGMHDIFSKAGMVLIALGSVPENVHMVLSVFSWVETYAAMDPLIRSKFLERLEQTQECGHRKVWVGHSLSTGAKLRKRATRAWAGLTRRVSRLWPWPLDSDLHLARGIEPLEYATQQLKTRHQVDIQSLLAIKTLLERLELFGVSVSPTGNLSQMSLADRGKKLKLAIDFPGLTEHLFHPNHQFWAGVYALSEIEWYQRVWTYQEVVLARRARVLAEDLSVCWDCVVVPTTSLLWATEDDVMFGKIDAEANIVGLPGFLHRRVWRVKWWKVGGSETDVEGMDLLHVLAFTRNRKSTVAKDKVYGLLALIRSDVRAQIPIDYTATDGEVFASAVKTRLEEDTNATIHVFWELFDGTFSAMEDLPSWCPNFASASGLVDWHHNIPDAVRQQTSAFACYEHSPGVQNIRVKALRLDTIAGCVDIACPLDGTVSQFSPPSDIEVSSTLETALKHWPVQLQATFSADDSAPGLAHEVTAFLHRTSCHNSLLPLETFRETLNHMLSFADSGLQSARVYDRRRDWAKYRDTLTILSIYSGRYLFKTMSGQIGFGTRQQTPGNHVVLLPGAGHMHMLTEDCTQYSGIVSLPGMREDALLDLVKARENMWEMVELR
jgi:hypothetical protein